MLDEKEKVILKKSWEYAKSKGFRLNPDRKKLEAIIKALAMTKAKYGKAFCPCRARTGNPEEDKKIICPCVFHLQELEEIGHCKCTLFYK